MSRQNDKEVRSFKKECAAVSEENVQMLIDIDDLKSGNVALVAELAEIKLKMTTTPGATAGLTAVAKTLGATAGLTAVAKTPGATAGATAEKPEDRKSLKKRSKFYVGVWNTRRPIQSMDTPVVDRYKYVDRNCESMDDRTGVYTTPTRGRYKFGGGVYVYGKGGFGCYMCGGDGRRKLLGERRDGDWYGEGMDCVGVYGHVVWDCPQGMTVWMELVGDYRVDVNTKFNAVFEGELLD